MLKQEVAGWTLQSAENAASYATQHNPTGCYAWIKKNYGTEFPTFAKGYERNDDAKNRMYNFIILKAKQSGNENAYIVTFLNQVPATGAPTFQ